MEWIAWRLEEAGYSTCLQSRDDPRAVDFVERVRPATLRAERTIVLLSPEYLVGVLSLDDWQETFAKDPSGEKGLVVPLCVDATNASNLLPEVACIDLVGLNVREVQKRLLDMARDKRDFEPVHRRLTAVAPRPLKRRPLFPGAAPRIWNIPFARNPYFAGRDQLLDDLALSLTT